MPATLLVAPQIRKHNDSSEIYNHYRNIKLLHKIQIFLLPLTSLYTVEMVFTNVTTTAQFYANKQVPEGTKFNKFSGIHFKFSRDP